MDQLLFWLVPAASVLALCFAWYFHHEMMKESEGTPQMIKIAAAVRKGAMSYLRQQYKIVGWVFLGLVILFSIMAYGFGVQNSWVPIAFLTGGFFSGLSGFLGMKTATYASARTANAARTSLNAGLRVAFRSGAVMGLVVVGLGLLDISFWYLLLNAVIPEEYKDPKGWWEHCFDLQTSRFIDLIEKGGPCEPGIADAIYTMRATDAVRESMRRGVTVNLECRREETEDAGD